MIIISNRFAVTVPYLTETWKTDGRNRDEAEGGGKKKANATNRYNLLPRFTLKNVFKRELKLINIAALFNFEWIEVIRYYLN